MSSSYTSLAGTDLDEGTLQYLSGPETAHDIELAQANRASLPMSPSDLSIPAGDLPTWAECLLPAGFHGQRAGRRHRLQRGRCRHGGQHVGAGEDLLDRFR